MVHEVEHQDYLIQVPHEDVDIVGDRVSHYNHIRGKPAGKIPDFCHVKERQFLFQKILDQGLPHSNFQSTPLEREQAPSDGDAHPANRRQPDKIETPLHILLIRVGNHVDYDSDLIDQVGIKVSGNDPRGQGHGQDGDIRLDEFQKARKGALAPNHVFVLLL